MNAQGLPTHIKKLPDNKLTKMTSLPHGFNLDLQDPTTSHS